MTKAKRVTLYVRVSTDDQTVENQKRELQAWAERCGHGVVKVFEDRGISGSKGRDKRPGFDAMLKAAVRREFDMLAVWSSDRLGRSLQHLIEVLQTIRDISFPHFRILLSLQRALPAYDHPVPRDALPKMSWCCVHSCIDADRSRYVCSA